MLQSSRELRDQQTQSPAVGCRDKWLSQQPPAMQGSKAPLRWHLLAQHLLASPLPPLVRAHALCRGTLSLCVESSTFAPQLHSNPLHDPAGTPANSMYVDKSTTCFYIAAKCNLLPLIPLLGGMAARILFSIFLLALCIWPSAFELVCLGASLFPIQPRASASLFPSMDPFNSIHVAGKAGSNTQAGRQSPSTQGSFNSNSSDASIPMASSPKAGPLPSMSPSPAAAEVDFASQPQMADLPKHGKSDADNTAAAPPKVRIMACLQYFCWRHTECVQYRNEFDCMTSASVLQHSIANMLLSFLSTLLCTPVSPLPNQSAQPSNSSSQYGMCMIEHTALACARHARLP